MDSVFLFKKDVHKYPGAIYDYNTTNDSFKKLVVKYSKMGKKNCAFILFLLSISLSVFLLL